MNEGAAILETEKRIEDTEKGYEYRTTSSTPSSSDIQISPKSNDIPTSEKFDAVAKDRKVKKSKKNKKGQEVAVEEEQDPFAHLPEHEREVLRRQLVVRDVPVTYRTLFRYATKADLLIMAAGAIGSIVGG